jgi:hypothetical protein
MEKTIETIEINVSETYAEHCVEDAFNAKISKIRRPQGEVHVYEVTDEGKRKLLHKNNLVLYQGREVMAQRIVNTENPNVDSTANEFIAWFGIGEGGVDPADPFTPVAPILTDTDLYNEYPFNATEATYGDFRSGSYYKSPFDSVEFEQDSLNDDKWLVLKITTTLGIDDGNGGQLSEAGLFTASSTNGGWAGPFHLFARVTFPSIVKTTARRIIFVWYLYV